MNSSNKNKYDDIWRWILICYDILGKIKNNQKRLIFGVPTGILWSWIYLCHIYSLVKWLKQYLYLNDCLIVVLTLKLNTYKQHGIVCVGNRGLAYFCDHISITEYIDWIKWECCVGFRKHLRMSNENMLKCSHFIYSDFIFHFWSRPIIQDSRYHRM